MKVAIVNRCRHICTSLKAILTHTKGFKVSTYTSSTEFLASLKKRMPDVCVMDIAIEDIDGYDLIRILKKHYPSLRVLVISQYRHPFAINWMIKHGVKGFISINSGDDQIRKAIRDISYGYHYSELATSELFDDIETGKVKVVKIDGRQKETLKHLCMGRTILEITERMNLSRYTITDNCERIYRKLDMKSCRENRRYLIYFALESGLVRIQR